MTALSADRPILDPKDDLFGHAPFAESIAKSIRHYKGSDGLVLALYGPWGSGKSTVLSFVQYYLEQGKEGDNPVIIPFNPWWFSGQENLARAFLGQLQAVLPDRNEKFKRLGELLGQFSEGVGGIADLSGMTGGMGSKLGKLFALLVKQKPVDVPALKAKINRILREAGTRILVLIDDIDRLTPEESRQVFTVVKALGDFPNVVYLLAFDREVATQAIGQQIGLDGTQYLEKIIQVPFELPPVDKVALRATLFRHLEKIIHGTADGLFDPAYWTNVYNDGLDGLFRVPRDVVRFTNTLAVTYPSVRNEVNPVDFIAVEALRVFIPSLYDVVRNSSDMFSGHSISESPDLETRKTSFHAQWKSDLRAEMKSSMPAMMERIFPKLDQVGHGADWLPEWRKKLRVCHPDLFPVYFRLTIPAGAVRRSDILSILSLGENPVGLGEMFLKSAQEKRPDGLSKARAILERLMDHIESDLSSKHVPVFVKVLLDVGDGLIVPSDEQGFFDFGNELRVVRVVYRLLKRIEPSERLPLLKTSVSQGSGIEVQRFLLASLLKDLGEETERNQAALMNESDLEEVKATWLHRLRERSGTNDLLSHSKLPGLLAAWSAWANPMDVQNWCAGATSSDDNLLKFVSSFLSHTRSQAMGDWAVRLIPRLNPRWLEPYIDTSACAQRLAALQHAGAVPPNAEEAVAQFLKEYEMIGQGKDPDGAFAFD